MMTKSTAKSPVNEESDSLLSGSDDFLIASPVGVFSAGSSFDTNERSDEGAAHFEG